VPERIGGAKIVQSGPSIGRGGPSQLAGYFYSNAQFNWSCCSGSAHFASPRAYALAPLKAPRLSFHTQVPLSASPGITTRPRGHCLHSFFSCVSCPVSPGVLGALFFVLRYTFESAIRLSPFSAVHITFVSGKTNVGVLALKNT
jgi:hypothetical protein